MIACYAAWNRKKDELVQSTSGGVFSALAELILSAGGIVVGVAYGKGLRVEYRVAHNSNELAALRGVKYVFSALERGVLMEMERVLAARRPVMFVGVPCQAAAIRKRFGEDRDLLLCDLVCFGTPPNSIWLKYVEWMERESGKSLKCISPRDKSKGWGKKTYYRYDWMDGTVTRRLSIFDPYAQAFYTTLAFRECCFNCQFRGVVRISDLTLCDMWNVQALDLPASVLHGGVSGVMVHSALGDEIFKKADVDRRKISPDVFVQENFPVFHSARKPSAWEPFNADSQKLSFGDLARKYRLFHRPVEFALSQACDFLKILIWRMLPGRVKDSIKSNSMNAEGC